MSKINAVSSSFADNKKLPEPKGSSVQIAENVDDIGNENFSIDGTSIVPELKAHTCIPLLKGKQGATCSQEKPENKITFKSISVLQKPSAVFNLKSNGYKIGLSPKVSFSDQRLSLDGITISVQKNIDPHVSLFSNLYLARNFFDKNSRTKDFEGGFGVCCKF